MLDLPQDVWELVAYYIPVSELDILLPVNRAFFNIVLDTRYKTVEWAILDKELIRRLGQLQYPSIASRVRRLHVRPWFIQYLVERERLFEQTSHDETEDQSTWQQQAWAQITNLFGFPSIYTSAPTNSRSFHVKKGLGYVASRSEIMSAMINAVKLMVHVTEYEFWWKDLPLNGDTRTFLSSTVAGLNGSLSKLVLHAPISKLESFLTATKFSGLTELEFHFDFDPEGEVDGGASEEVTLVSFLAPYINHLTSPLGSLKIISPAKRDHSTFLRALGHAPTLRVIALRISFELSDPSSIGDLLHRHKSRLTSIDLRPNDDEVPRNEIQSASTLQNWSAISSHCLANTSWLENLESVAIPALHYPTALCWIRHSPISLTSFCLSSRYLEHHEAAEVIALLGSRTSMRRLSLEVKEMTPGLISLLANTFPGLFSLTLVLESDSQAYSDWGFQRAGYQIQAHWQLFDLSLFVKRGNGPATYKDGHWEAEAREHRLMARLSHYLPNVRSFRGRVHMG